MAFGPTNLQGLNTFFALTQANGGVPPGTNQSPGGGATAPAVAPVDVVAAFKTGEQAADNAPMAMARGGRVRGYADGGAVDDYLSVTGGAQDDDTSDDDYMGLSNVNPMLIAMMQHEVGTRDDTPTREDKGLALAQAGFSAAAGQSPHALSNLGAGASAGVEALQKLKQQRALMRLKESQAAQQTALRSAALMDAAQQKAAALKAAKDKVKADNEVRTDAIEQRRQAASDAAAAKKAAADAANAAAADKATALAETRYNTAAGQRLRDYNSTGVWRKLDADADHGITGAPEEDKYTGPLIGDPTVPLKERNKLKIAQPNQEQAVTVVSHNLDQAIQKAIELKKHPGLSNAVGFGGGVASSIPGTDAASFKSNLKSLLSTQFAQAIQAMRDASKTGGAVGNVSDREGDRFENMIASLDQSQDEEQFKKNLDKIIDYSDFLKNSYRTKYKETYGDIKEPEKPNLPAAAAAGVMSLKDRLAKPEYNQ